MVCCLYLRFSLQQYCISSNINTPSKYNKSSLLKEVNTIVNITTAMQYYNQELLFMPEHFCYFNLKTAETDSHCDYYITRLGIGYY